MSVHSRTSGASSSTTASATLKVCGMPCCDDPTRGKDKWCKRHQNHYNNRRYEKEHSKGGSVEIRKSWVDRMSKDPTFAVQELEKQEQDNAGVGKWKNTNKQNQNSTWNEDRGHRINKETGETCSPYEKQQWVIKKVSKFGWTNERALAMWRDLLQGKYEQDFDGDEGQVRLWLPKEFKTKARQDYHDISARTASDVIKDATADETDALRMHVHEKSSTMHHGQAFFQGKSGVYEGGPKKLQLQNDAKPDNEDSQADAADSGNEEPEIKKLKGNIVKLRTGVYEVAEKFVRSVALARSATPVLHLYGVQLYGNTVYLCTVCTTHAALIAHVHRTSIHRTSIRVQLYGVHVYGVQLYGCTVVIVQCTMYNCTVVRFGCVDWFDLCFGVSVNIIANAGAWGSVLVKMLANTIAWGLVGVRLGFGRDLERTSEPKRHPN